MRHLLTKITASVIIALCANAALAQGGGASAPAPGAHPAPVPNAKVTAAIQAYAAGDAVGAAKACEAAIAEQPDCEPEARMVLAEILAGQGDFEGARQQEVIALAKAQQFGGPGCPAAGQVEKRKAQIDLRRSEFSGLVAGLEDTIKANPDAPEAVRARYKLACWYAAYEQNDEAIKQLTSLIKDNPEAPEAERAFSMLEAVYVQAGQADQAKAALPSLAEASKSTALYYQLARFYARLGDNDKAQAAYAQAGSRRPAAGPTGGKGPVRQDPEQALAPWQELIATNPDSPQALYAKYDIACIYTGLGKYDEATAYLCDVIWTGGDKPVAHQAFRALAAIYLQADQGPLPQAGLPRLLGGAQSGAASDNRLAALKAQAQAQNGSADGQQAQYELGCLYVQQKSYADAAVQFTALLQAHPEAARAGRALRLLSLTSAANPHLSPGVQALAANVQQHAAASSEALLEVCFVYQDLGLRKEGLALAQTIVDTFPHSPEAPRALLWMAEVQPAAADAPVVEATLGKLLDGYPDSEAACTAVQDLKVLYEKHDGALEAGLKLQKIAAAHPGTQVAATSKGFVRQIATDLGAEGLKMADAGNYQKAIDLCTQSLSLIANPALIYQEGICYSALGQKDAAIAQFQLVIRDYPEFDLSNRAQQWVDKLSQSSTTQPQPSVAGTAAAPPSPAESAAAEAAKH